MEAMEADVKFKLNVKTNKISTDVTDMVKKSLEEILIRLTSLEK